MKAKVIVIDKDVEFAKRFTKHFAKYYSKTFEIYCFSNYNEVFRELDLINPKFILITPEFKNNVDEYPLPSGIPVYYFVDSKSVKKVYDETAVIKYQEMDALYRDLLNIFFENTIEYSYNLESENLANVTCFTSPAGGVGTTSVAVAYSQQMAATGKKVLYFCLKPLEDSAVFFKKPNRPKTFSDIVYALKTKRNNLELAIESSVCNDVNRQVSYIPSPVNPVDMLELTASETDSLIDAVVSLEYDEIVIDCATPFDGFGKEALLKSNHIVYVTDCSNIANRKIERVFKALSSTEVNWLLNFNNQISVFYNSITPFSKRLSLAEGILEFGQANLIENFDSKLSEKEIVSELVKVANFSLLSNDDELEEAWEEEYAE